jgi:hypothetical protein
LQNHHHHHTLLIVSSVGVRFSRQISICVVGNECVSSIVLR